MGSSIEESTSVGLGERSSLLTSAGESSSNIDDWDAFNLALRKDNLEQARVIIEANHEFFFWLDNEGKSLIEVCIDCNAFKCFKYLISVFASNPEIFYYIDLKSEIGLNPLLRLARKFRDGTRDDLYVAQVITGNTELTKEELVGLELEQKIKAWREDNAFTEEEAIQYATILFEADADPLREGKYKGNVVSWKSFIKKEDGKRLYALFEEATRSQVQRVLEFKQSLLEERVEDMVAFLRGNLALLTYKVESDLLPLEFCYVYGYDESLKTILSCRQEILERAALEGVDLTQLSWGFSSFVCFVEMRLQNDKHKIIQQGQAKAEEIERVRVSLFYSILTKNDHILDSRGEQGENVLHVCLASQCYLAFRCFLNHRFPDTINSFVFTQRKEKKKAMMSETNDPNPNKFDLDSKDNLGRTPLFYGIELAQNEEDIICYVRDLLAKGADPDLADTHGQTALHLAAKKGFKKVVRMLVSSVYEVFSEKDLKKDLEIEGHDQERSLKKNVASINKKDTLGLNFLHYIFSLGHASIMKHFQHKGIFHAPIVDALFEKDKDEDTPLDAGFSSKNAHTRQETLKFVVGAQDTLREHVRNLSKRFKRESDELNRGKSPYRELRYNLILLLREMGECGTNCYDTYYRKHNVFIGLMSVLVLRFLGELLELQSKIDVYGEKNDERQGKRIEEKSHKLIVNFLSRAGKICGSERYKIIIIKILNAARAVFSLDENMVQGEIEKYLSEVDLNNDDYTEEGYSEVGEGVGFNDFIARPKVDQLALHRRIAESKSEDEVLAFLQKEEPDWLEASLEVRNEWGDGAIKLAAERSYWKLVKFIYDKTKYAANVNIIYDNDSGVNFLHDAFSKGELGILEAFMVNETFFTQEFYDLMRQRDITGKSPIYMGMVSTSKKTKCRTEDFINNLIGLVNDKIDALDTELEYFRRENSDSIDKLSFLLKGILQRVKYEKDPKFKIKHPYNANMVLVYLSILELIDDLHLLSIRKENAAGDKAQLDQINEDAGVCIENFSDGMYQAAYYNEIIDIVKTVALIAAAVVAGVGLGILIGALLAWLTGITAVVMLGLSAFELGGAVICGAGLPIGMFFLAKNVFFGFNRDSHEIADECLNLVNDGF